MEENYELYHVDYEQPSTNIGASNVLESLFYPFSRHIPTRFHNSNPFLFGPKTSDTHSYAVFSDPYHDEEMSIPMFNVSEKKGPKVGRIWKRILWTITVISSILLMACIVSTVYFSVFSSGVQQPEVLLASSISSAMQELNYETDENIVLQSATRPTTRIINSNANRHPEESNDQSAENLSKTLKTKPFKIQPSVTHSSPTEWVSSTQMIHNTELRSVSIDPSFAMLPSVRHTKTIFITSIKGTKVSESDSLSELHTALFTDFQSSSYSLQSSKYTWLLSSENASSRNIPQPDKSTSWQSHITKPATIFNAIPTFESSTSKSKLETLSGNMLSERIMTSSSKNVIVLHSTKATLNSLMKKDSVLLSNFRISSDYQTEVNDIHLTLKPKPTLQQSTTSVSFTHTWNSRVINENQLMSQAQYLEPTINSILESTFSSASKFKSDHAYSSKHQIPDFSSSDEIWTSSGEMHLSSFPQIRPTKPTSTLSFGSTPQFSALKSFPEKSMIDEFVTTRILTMNQNDVSSDWSSKIQTIMSATHTIDLSSLNSNLPSSKSSSIEVLVSDSDSMLKSYTESTLLVDLQSNSKHVESSDDSFYFSLENTLQTDKLITFSSQVSSKINGIDITSSQDHLSASASSIKSPKLPMYYTSSESIASFIPKFNTVHSEEITSEIHLTKYLLNPNSVTTEASSSHILSTHVDITGTDSDMDSVLQSTADSSDSTYTLSSIEGTFMTLKNLKPLPTTNIVSVYFDSTEHSLSEIVSTTYPSSSPEKRHFKIHVSVKPSTISLLSLPWTEKYHTDIYTGYALTESEFGSSSTERSFWSYPNSISITHAAIDPKSPRSSPTLSEIDWTVDYLYSSTTNLFPRETHLESESQDNSRERFSFLSDRSLLTNDRIISEYTRQIVDVQSNIIESTAVYSIPSESTGSASNYQTSNELTTSVLLDDTTTSMYTFVSSTIAEENSSASVLPEIPVVSLPVEIVENRILEEFKCLVETIDPVTDVGWSVTFTDGKYIDNYNFSEFRLKVTTTYTESSTYNHVSTFRPELSMDWHNSSLCCYINKDGFKHSTCKDILIIPSNYCAVNKTSSFLTHPYDACNYIHCGSGYRVHVRMCPYTTCFNKDTNNCIHT